MGLVGGSRESDGITHDVFFSHETISKILLPLCEAWKHNCITAVLKKITTINEYSGMLHEEFAWAALVAPELVPE